MGITLNNIIALILLALLTARTAEGFFTKFLYRTTITFEESAACRIKGTKRYAIIIHGWRESCRIPWSIQLAQNLKRYREGCIICMDYHLLASMPNYFMLAKRARDIASVLTDKLIELENRGFDPNEAFLFGFSLGGRIALEAGHQYGKQKIAEIDTCDMAGPGFDKYELPDPKDAAQNVQCIHTSRDKGTRTRECHQNWNMGYCGESQMAAGKPPLGSHGLCPVFYNAAFKFNFFAEFRPKQCSKRTTGLRKWPKKFRMGYMENRKFDITGEFYAATTMNYPFTSNLPDLINFPALQDNHVIMIYGGNEYIL